MFGFDILAKSKNSNARAGVLRTAHGMVETPVFMPVGTLGSVKSLSPEDFNSFLALSIIEFRLDLLGVPRSFREKESPV